MKYTVKNVKSFTGREGYGYSCSLYKDGKNIGTVTDTADGGEADLYLNSRDLEDELRDYVNSLPLGIFDGMEFAVSVESFVGGLVDEFQNAKRLAKLTKNNWVYKFKDKEDGVLSFFSKNLDKALIEQKFADQILECLN